MPLRETIIAAVLISVVCVCLLACVIVCMCIVRGGKRRSAPFSLKAWWKTHKPTKRRLIQVYAALLVNANIKGFATGSIYTGGTKYLCTPGLNCYSCPGAVGACPLGALQNALASSGTRAPFYVLGILMLYGMLLGRTICGFLCPVGLGQDLLYKIRTPKARKNRLSRIFSYLKYVILAVLVVAVPVMFGVFGTRVPAFCKYICPAGTLGGAIGLLIHPGNADLFGQLGALFTWKFALLVAAVVACIFIYRFFCRFLCPLGALYGLFNRFALLGVKLDKNKCTDCGLCLAHCKMDIRRVGDHECINCGECISVCPAHAISWKGSKLFVHANAAEPLPVPAERPLAALLKNTAEEPDPGHGASEMCVAAPSERENVQAPSASFVSSDLGHGTPEKPQKSRRPRSFWLQIASWAAALALLCGALVYYNFIAKTEAVVAGAPYELALSSRSEEGGEAIFTILPEGADEAAPAEPASGSGTPEDPFELAELCGSFRATLPAEGELIYHFFVEEDAAFVLLSESEDLSLRIYYRDAQGEEVVAFTAEGTGRTPFTLSSSPEGMPVYGNAVGDLCYDFTLSAYGEASTFRLSAHRGRLVLINFWYTECGPCKEEMPMIADLAEKYASSMDVVAIHSARIYTSPQTAEGVQAWLDSTSLGGRDTTWSQTNIIFAQDNGAGLYSSETYALLGGKSSYPLTLLLDEEGVILYVRQGALREETITARIEAALAD